MLKSPFLLFLLFLNFTLFAQDYSVSKIPAELKENANAVVRGEYVQINILAADKMLVRTRRAVTVLNKHGNKLVFAGEFYSEGSEIKKLEARIFDANGEEIKKYKSRDFEDRSVSGANDVTDNRIKFIDYKPHSYPYTILFESEVENISTAFIQPFEPVQSFFLSIENSTYQLKNPQEIPLRFKETNLEGLEITKNNSEFELSYKLKNFPAYDHEYLSRDFKYFSPSVLVALNNFSLVGVNGSASSWGEMGKWQFDYLLSNKMSLPQTTIVKIGQLVADAENDVEKAKRIYEYMQGKTRYVSIQLGIGGWEPMLASEVDRLGYGDCKGLTNYMRALLASQGINSNYAVVYAGDEKRDIEPEFASMQGNHVILNVPIDGREYWLECTSQTHPFNYLGDFTDDRNVLLVTPEGGRIVKTPAYTSLNNIRQTTNNISLDETGNFHVETIVKSKGVPYGNAYPLERIKESDQILYYKNLWSNLKGLEFESVVFSNDKNGQEFTEQLKYTGSKHAKKIGNQILLPLNFFLTDTYNLPRKSEKSLKFEIQRGVTYRDSFNFLLPAGYDVDFMPENIKLQSEFGHFQLDVELKEEEGKKIIAVNRNYSLSEGIWPAEKYTEFREFLNKIGTFNNTKAILVANNS